MPDINKESNKGNTNMIFLCGKHHTDRFSNSSIVALVDVVVAQR